MSDQEKEKDAKGVPLEKWANDGEPTDAARQQGYQASMKDYMDATVARMKELQKRARKNDGGAKEQAQSK